MKISDYNTATEKLTTFTMLVKTVNYGVKYNIKTASKRLEVANKFLNSK